jgi:hypothetical protein
MPDSEEVDEVVLNTLLAEGVDVPTAWEASRYRTSESPTGGTGAALVFFAVVLLALALGLWLVVAG